MQWTHVRLGLFLGILTSVFAVVPVRATPPDLTHPTLYLVGYAHLDTQWRWSYPQTIQSFIPNTFNQNFSLFPTYPDYIFNFTGIRRYQMMKEYYPGSYPNVKAYCVSGRWFPAGACASEGDVDVPGAESIVRQVLYGNHFYLNEFGKTSSEYLLPDCFGFPASLPTLLNHAGLKGFSTQKLTWGSAVGIPFNVGVWTGPDGTSVLAALNAGAYVSTISSNLSNDSTWLARINTNGAQSGLYCDYAYYGVGDQGGGPTSTTVSWFETSVNGTGPVHVIPCTAAQMFEDLSSTNTSGLPHYQGDLLLTQHSAGSATSQGYMKRWNRRNETLADAAERASVFAAWMGGPAYPMKRLNDAWLLVLDAQYHDMIAGTCLPKSYEYTWSDELLSENQFADVLTGAAGSIAASLDTRAQGVSLVVYNPLSIDRQDLVEASVNLPGGPVKAVRVVGPDGLEVPSQILGVHGSATRVLFQANVPSVGFAVYDVQPAATPAASTLIVSASSLENARYIVTLDGNGDVASIQDKAAGRAMLASAARLAFLHDSPSAWPAWNIDWADAQAAPQAYVAAPASVQIVENGAARIAVQIARTAQGSRFVQTIRLSAGDAGNRVEFENNIDWESSVCNLKAVFPLAVANSNATYNWEVGTIQRGNNTSVKYEVPAHQWFDLTSTNGAYGVTVLTDCKFSSDKPDNQTLRLTLLRTPGSSTSTGYQDESTQDWGRHEILYGLVGHTGDWRSAQSDWQAYRLNQPLVAFATSAHNGALGKTPSLLRVSNSRVRALAVKKAEDSNETIVRLVELSGLPAMNVHVSLPTGIISAREVNGQEQAVGPATVMGGELVADFTAYHPRAFALTLGSAPTQLPAAPSQAVTLPYNHAVTSSNGQVSSAGIDSNNRCIPAEMLPATIAYRGVNFQLGPVGGGQLNAVACSGQAVATPAGTYNRLYLLAAAGNGDKTVTFMLDGAPVVRKIQDWGGYIGQWYNRVWSGTVPAAPPTSWTYPLVGITPPYNRTDPVAWFCSHRHTSAGADEYYAYCYLYAYAIDLTPGPHTLTLPNNNQVYILAASVVNDPASSTTPAQSLVERFQSAPLMTPIAVTGFNRDIVVESTAVSPYASYAQAFDVPNAYAYYEHNLSGGAARNGMPTGGSFTSNIDQTTQVQLQPYNASNALFLNTNGGPTSGTLTFAAAAQRPYDALAVFAVSANALQTSTGTLSITFTDNSTAGGLTYNAFDWFFHVGDNALANLGRLQLSNNTFDTAQNYEPRVYQTTIDLAAMGLNHKAIQRLTFGIANGTGTTLSTAIVAVSGAAVPRGDVNCDGQTTIADAALFALALIDPAGYQAANPNCDRLRGDMNGDGVVDSADIQLFVNAAIVP